MKQHSTRYGVTAFACSVAISSLVLAFPAMAGFTIVVGSAFAGFLCAVVCNIGADE